MYIHTHVCFRQVLVLQILSGNALGNPRFISPWAVDHWERYNFSITWQHDKTICGKLDLFANRDTFIGVHSTYETTYMNHHLKKVPNGFVKLACMSGNNVLQDACISLATSLLPLLVAIAPGQSLRSRSDDHGHRRQGKLADLVSQTRASKASPGFTTGGFLKWWYPKSSESSPCMSISAVLKLKCLSKKHKETISRK